MPVPLDESIEELLEQDASFLSKLFSEAESPCRCDERLEDEGECCSSCSASVALMRLRVRTETDD